MWKRRAMFSEAIKAIIDLLKIQKEAKKTDLEIDKLKREKAASESVIQPHCRGDL